MYQFIPHPPFNVVYRDEFVIASFQHCLGGRGGGSYSSDFITDSLQNSFSMHFEFMLSDSGVPRTFVGDCRLFQVTMGTMTLPHLV